MIVQANLYARHYSWANKTIQLDVREVLLQRTINLVLARQKEELIYRSCTARYAATYPSQRFRVMEGPNAGFTKRWQVLCAWEEGVHNK